MAVVEFFRKLFRGSRVVDAGIFERCPYRVGGDGKQCFDMADVDAWHIRLRIAVSKLLPTTHGYGCCASCRLPWWLVDGADVQYSEGGGMFAICLMCWKDIGDPEKIIPFYRELFFSWPRRNHPESELKMVEANIRRRKLGIDYSIQIIKSP